MGRWVRYIDTRRQPQVRPRPGQFISGYREDYAVDGGRLALTPDKLGRIFRNADSGYTRELFEVFAAVEEDPHVHSVLSKRKRRVLARPLEIAPAIEGDSRAEDAADLCRRLVFGDQGEDGIVNWNESLDALVDAIGRGFALCQIIWDTSTTPIRPLRLERWPQRDCIVGDMDNPELSSDEVRVVTRENMIRGEPLEPWAWVKHVSKARQDGLAKAAMLRIVAWWWLFKHFAGRDWVIYCERFGMPLRIGKYPKGTSDDERQALLAAVMTIGKDGGAVIPEGAEVDFVEVAKGAAQLPFPALLEACDFQISKAVLGGTLTTEAGDRGARSLGEVHERNEADIAERDGQALSETIRRDLLTPIVLFNMPGAPIPRVTSISGEQESQKERAERDEILARMGLPLPKAYLYETYGVPVPEEGDDLVNDPDDEPEPPAVPPPPAPEEDEEDDEVDAQLNRTGMDLATTILGADQVQQLRDLGTPVPAIIALANDRAKKNSMPWVTPTR